MTEAQKKVYDFIVEYTKEHLYAPSIRDICIGCYYSSTSTVNNHLYKLQHKGLIELGKEQGNPRCIKLIGYKLVKEDEMIKLYGFYNDKKELIDKVPALGLEEAKEIHQKDKPDIDYMYIEILYPT